MKIGKSHNRVKKTNRKFHKIKTKIVILKYLLKIFLSLKKKTP